MAESSIEWTDATWNPVTGCTRASAGCDNCYAVKMTKRLAAMGQAKYSGLVNVSKNHFNGVVKCHEDALTIPLKWRKPQRIFVNSMSDLFHKDVPFEFIDKVFAVMALAPQHTFQILTKRPERMAEYFEINKSAVTLFIDRAPSCDNGKWCDLARHMSLRPGFRCFPLPNVWLGTSVENQATAEERIPHLLRVPAAVRFLSCEPLLGPVDLTRLAVRRNFIDCLSCDYHDGQGTIIAGPPSGTGPIDWVICGGESGPKARPMDPVWARSLRDQCVAAGVPFFFKQWGEWVDEMHDEANCHTQQTSDAFVTLLKDEAGNVCDYEGFYMCRAGKAKAGRLLDGRTWDEFPEVER